MTALNAVTSLTLNSDMDIFPQVLQNFQKTASKSEYILSLPTFYFENCITYIAIYCYIDVTYTCDILQFILRNHWTWTRKILDCVFGLGLALFGLIL